MKPYLLNTNSKRIHLSDSTDGRCRLGLMRDEYKVYFDTLEEALTYPSSEKPLGEPCTFCLKAAQSHKQIKTNEQPYRIG